MESIDLVEKIESLMEKRQARRERIIAEQADKAAAVESKRQQLRDTMPEVAAFVDSVRAVFGEGVRVLMAEENGQRVETKRRM